MKSDTLLDQAGDVALSILDESRASLMLALRFMDTALWRMPFAVRTLRRAAGTDGRVLYVDVVRTIERYRDVPSEVVRDHLHVILHCIFRHPFDDGHPNRAA